MLSDLDNWPFKIDIENILVFFFFVVFIEKLDTISVVGFGFMDTDFIGIARYIVTEILLLKPLIAHAITDINVAVYYVLCLSPLLV